MAENIIKTIYLRLLHNETHFRFHQEVAAAAASVDAAALHFGDLAARHAELLAALAAAIEVIVKSAITEEIHALDVERYNLYRGLVAASKAALRHYDPGVRAAAGRVRIVVKFYRYAITMDYEEKSGVVQSLTEDLMSAEYAADAAESGIAEWVAKLAAANAAFNERMAARDKERVRRRRVPVKAARRAIDHIYYKLVDRVNSYIYDGSPNAAALNGFVDKVNVITKRFALLIPKPKSKKGAAVNAAAGASEAASAPPGLVAAGVRDSSAD